MFAFLSQKATPVINRQLLSFSAPFRCRTVRTIYREPRAHASATVPEQAVSTAKVPNKIEPLLASGLGVVILKRGKARLFRDLRNSMVYGGAVERCIPPPGHPIQTSDPVAVVDGAMDCLGYGFYNEHSMFRVRLLRHDAVPLPWNFAADIRASIRAALQLRKTLGLPRDDTNLYRVVNGEGDRLSGLAVDRIGDTAVVSSSAMWCERYKDEITGALNEELTGCEIIWRQNLDRLRQDGLVLESKNDNEEGQDEKADASDLSVATECGVQYGLSGYAITRGQKTGHYADQRENRAYVRELVKNGGARRVLDLFCYTGGFGINAALGGAAVTAVDSSGIAVDMARANASLNGVEDLMDVRKEDVVEFLRSCEDSFDMVIADPPKYAPKAATLTKATRKYVRLNELAVRKVRPGGLLVTCSCSGAVTREKGLFLEIVRKAARAAGRDVVLVKMTGAAGDHPIAVEMPETEYLTVGVFIVR